jgi:ribosome-associated protein
VWTGHLALYLEDIGRVPTKAPARKGKISSPKGKVSTVKSKSAAKPKASAKALVKAPAKVPVKAKVTKPTASKSKAPSKTALPKPQAAPALSAALSAAAKLKDMVEQSLDADKAEQIVSYDLVGRSSLTDYMIIASGKSARQVTAMAEHLRDKLESAGKNPHIEGMTSGDWVLVDAGDVIVHLFRPEVREFYQLDSLWAQEAAVASGR